MTIRLHWIAASLLAWVASDANAKQAKGADSSFRAETIPHQPNFLGHRICLGIESLHKGWDHPTITSTWKLDADGAEHRITFDPGDSVVVAERLGTGSECRGIVGPAGWRHGSANFCLKGWNGEFIKVSFVAEGSPSNFPDLSRSIYNAAACQLGSGGSFLGYGMVLKAGSVPVHVED